MPDPLLLHTRPEPLVEALCRSPTETLPWGCQGPEGCPRSHCPTQPHLQPLGTHGHADCHLLSFTGTRSSLELLEVHEDCTPLDSKSQAKPAQSRQPP